MVNDGNCGPYTLRVDTGRTATGATIVDDDAALMVLLLLVLVDKEDIDVTTGAVSCRFELLLLVVS
jgi:hypothetical protein